MLQWLRKIWAAVVGTPGSLTEILDRLGKLMATVAEFSAKLDALEAAIAAHNQTDIAKVTALQAELDAAKAELAKGGLTADEEAAQLSRIEVLTAQLSPPAA